MTLFLITNTFPYSHGEEFLETEIHYLVSHFNRVIVLPRNVSGPCRKLPNGVEVEPGLATALSGSALGSTFALFRWPGAWHKGLRLVRFLFRHPSVASRTMKAIVRRPWWMRRALTNAYHIIVTQEWCTTYLGNNSVKCGPMLFYSYWTNSSILGVQLACQRRDNMIRVISRAHGGDLYEDITGEVDWPFRDDVLHALDRVFLISEHGMDYMCSRRPWMKDKAELSRLGVGDCWGGPKEPQDDRIVLCSCAGLNPVKRVDLLIQALGIVGAKHPDREIEWHHIGDGRLRTELSELASTCLPDNVTYTFHGHLPNSRVIHFYREHYVDAFVNTSASEGIPVSIMEAQNAGIPVIATAVGGTPELVNANNGVLLMPNPTTTEIEEAIDSIIQERDLWIQKRAASRQTWETMSNADNVYSDFAERIVKLLFTVDT